MRNPLKTARRLKDAFLEGPDWVEIPGSMAAIGGYKPRTLIALSWLYAIYERWMTAPGRMLITVFLAVALYSSILIRSPVSALLFALLALFIADFVVGFVFHPNLELRRELPRRVRAGSPFRVEYRLRNKRAFPAWDVILDPNLGSKALRRPGGPASTLHLAPKSEAFLDATLLPLRRGRLVLRRPLAESSYPFNVFKWTCRGGFSQTVTVHPAYHPLEELALPPGRRFQRQSMAAVSKVGESMEFHGCREFRTGDDPRKIHWLGSARRGELVLKEFQEERLSRVALILDTYAPPPKGLKGLLKRGAVPFSPDFEAAVSLTAAMSESLSRGEFVIDIFAAGPQVYHFQGGRSLAQLDDILDILSCIEPTHEEPFEKLSPELMEEIASIGAAYLILLRADAKAEALHVALQDSGTEVKSFLIAGTPGPQWAEALAPGDIHAGRVRRL